MFQQALLFNHQTLIPWGTFDPGDIASPKASNPHIWEPNVRMIYMQTEQPVSVQSTTLLYPRLLSTCLFIPHHLKPEAPPKLLFLPEKPTVKAFPDFLLFLPPPGWTQCFTVWTLIRECYSCFYRNVTIKYVFLNSRHFLACACYYCWLERKKKLFPNLSWMLPFIFFLLLAKDNYQHKLIFF